MFRTKTIAPEPEPQVSYDAEWEAYDAEWERRYSEAAANPPNGKYQIQQSPGDGVWRISVWSTGPLTTRPSTYRLFYGRGLGDYPPPDVKFWPSFYYHDLNKLEFKFKEEAERWLYQWLNPEEQTFGYDEKGKPL